MGRNPNCKCSVCGKPIYRRPFEIKRTKNGLVFCGKDCYGKYCQKPHACPICGESILASLKKKYCSRECANRSRTGISYNRGSRKSKVVYVEGLKQRLIETNGARCQVCGYDKNINILQVHHIKFRKFGGTDDLDNLMLLCPNCHAEKHYNGRLR